jgi:hypothetical protein
MLPQTRVYATNTILSDPRKLIPRDEKQFSHTRIERNSQVTVKRLILTVFLAFFLSVLFPPIYAQDEKLSSKISLDKDAHQLIGRWEIFETKEPGKPYLSSYKGRPFVSRGANAFTLILEYSYDGTFRRIARVGNDETVEEGTWRLSGHELRHKRK